MHTNDQNSSLLWLRAMLADEHRRAMLRTLLDQYELPVIDMGGRKSQQIRRRRIAPRNDNIIRHQSRIGFLSFGRFPTT